jgi:hypothetical protein
MSAVTCNAILGFLHLSISRLLRRREYPQQVKPGTVIARSFSSGYAENGSRRRTASAGERQACPVGRGVSIRALQSGREGPQEGFVSFQRVLIEAQGASHSGPD